jgi:hypothetical protein
MIKCETVRKDFNCQFMKASGCVFPGGMCIPVVPECEGCTNKEMYEDETYCKSYMNPASKWLSGRCPMCTVKINVKVVEQKINPIKASKKLAKTRKASVTTKSPQKPAKKKK